MSDTPKYRKPPVRRGPGGPMGAGEKAKDFKGTTKKLLRYMSGYKIAIAIVVIFAIGSTVFSIIGPKILGNATTELFIGWQNKVSGAGGIDFGKIGGILLTLIILYVSSALFMLVQNFIMSGITQKITYRLRREMSEKIHRLPMNFFDKKQHGEVLSVITNDIDTISMGLNQSATQLITSIVTIVGILIMMFSIDWIMTLIALLVMPVSGIIVSIVVKKSQQHFKNQQRYLGNVNGQIEECFGGVNIIQAFNKQDDVVGEFNVANEKLYKSGWKSQFLSGIMMPIMTFIGNISYVAIAVLGGYFAASGRITVGNIQSFIQYSRSFTQPITQISQVSNMLQSMAAAAERVFAFLEEEEENLVAESHAVKPDGEKVNVGELGGNVSFENVHFGYTEDRIIINDFSTNVKEGQKIAIVGPTGAGKTTIVKLLMRFYDINSGSIKVDGYDSESFDRSEFRDLFGMVLQDTWLFSGTIMENIRYGRLDATDEEVIAAAKAANVHKFVQTLPDGYNMMLNEDATNVSQGQKQLLTIARTILSNPKILILDEATSSVDTKTEVQIQEAMDNFMQGKTSFIIAHRLSTIKNADIILVMRDGDIVEQGNHEELLEAGGFYANLYNSQFDKVS